MFLLSGCSAFTFEEEPATATAPRAVVQLGGSWSGSIEVEGQNIPGTLVLRQSGDRIEASFTTSELGGDVTGTGEIGDAGEVEIELAYRTQCPARS